MVQVSEINLIFKFETILIIQSLNKIHQSILFKKLLQFLLKTRKIDIHQFGKEYIGFCNYDVIS